MPKVLPEYLEQRRRQIVEAAAACFSRRGFHQTTMQDICEEADLSPGALYRYFRSKEELIEAMCEHSATEKVEKIRGAMELGGTLAAFEELIRLFFVPVPDQYCAILIELTAESRRNEYIREFRSKDAAEILGQLEQFIRAGQARGEINPALDALAVSRVMMALYQGLIMQRLVEPDMDVTRYGEVARGLFGGTFWQGEKPTSEKPRTERAALRH